jgi:hypothetical protein
MVRTKLLPVLGGAAVCAALVFAAVAQGNAKGVRANLSCNGTENGQTFDNVDVPAGAVCNLNNDTILGDITVEGQLYGSVLDVGGSVTSFEGEVVQIDSSTIANNLKLRWLDGAPVSEDPVAIFDNDIGGSFWVKNSRGGTGEFQAASNTVSQDVVINKNMMDGNSTFADLSVTGDMTVYKNKGSGLKEVDANDVGGTLSCKQNKEPFESSGNTAGSIEGQCN